MAVILGEHGFVALHTHHRHLRAINLLGQIRTRDPGVAPIIRLEEAIAPIPHDVRIVRRQHVWRVPIEAILIAWLRVERVSTSAGAPAAPAASSPATATAAARWANRLLGAFL